MADEIRIFNDPGVYVVKAMKPTATIPVMPALPAAFIGPMYQIVDQDVDSLTDAVLSSEHLSGTSSVNIAYPSLISADSEVDLESVVVKAIRPDGREADITEICTVGEDSVTINYSAPATKSFLEELNDLWGGDSAKNIYKGIEGVPIHIEYRALRTDLVGKVLQAQGADGVLSVIGKGVLQNPLGLAGAIATRFTSGGIYFVPTTEDIAADIGTALALLEPLDVFAPVVLSDDPLVQQQVIEHVDRMSSEEEQKERFAWTAVTVPTKEDLINDKVIDENATLSEVKAAQKNYIKNYAKSIFNKNAAVLFQSFTTNIDGVDVELPAYYLAVAYAALKSQISPQQGLTNYPVGGLVKKLHYANNYFKPSDLKELSQAGVFVCVQDAEAAPIRCRFQVTTNMTNNKTKQVSLQYSVAFFSKSFRKTLDPLLGVNNVTASVLEQVEMTVSVFLGQMKAAGIIVRGAIETLRQNPDDPSQADVVVEVEFATPLDKIVMLLKY